jgi:amino acid permease
MNRKTIAGERRRRKLITIGWVLALTVIVISLIYFEKTAILYILCTLGVTALLVIVALSDLSHTDAPGSAELQTQGGPKSNRA